MKWFKLFDKYLGWAESTLLVLCLTVMISLGFVQVLLRNFFDLGISWADPLLRHLVLWIAFLGASLSTAKRKHINIDIVSRLLSPKGKLIAALVVDLASLIVVIFLTKAAYVFVCNEKLDETTAFADIPSWIVQIIIPVAFGLIGLRFFSHAIDSVIRLIKNEPLEIATEEVH